MKQRLFILLLEYTSRHQYAGVTALGHLARNLFPDFDPILVVVDNSLSAHYINRMGTNAYLINGDNSLREFSGMDRGLQWIIRTFSPSDEDGMLLANETFYQDAIMEHLAGLSPRLANAWIRTGKLAGHMIYFPRPVQLFGKQTRCYIQSHFMFCRFQTLKKLIPFCFPIDRDQIFSKDYQTFFAEPSPLSLNYRLYARKWLFGEENEAKDYHGKWRRACKPSTENHAQFQLKVLAMIFEHYLSIRAAQHQIRLQDIHKHRHLRHIKYLIYHPIRNLKYGSTIQ